jgi:hypothetical protein
MIITHSKQGLIKNNCLFFVCASLIFTAITLLLYSVDVWFNVLIVLHRVNYVVTTIKI